MTEEQRLSSKFETLSEEIVKYLFRNADAEVHRTRERNDGGYDVIVECHSGDKTNKAYFECKLRNKNLNLRDIAANVIIAFNHGAIAFVALTNHNFTQQTGSELFSFCQQSVLNIKIITGDSLKSLIRKSGIAVSDELQNLLGYQKTNRKDEFHILQIDLDADIVQQLFCRHDFPLEAEDKFFVENFSGTLERLVHYLNTGNLTIVHGYWGVGKSKMIGSALKSSCKRVVHINAQLHETKDPLILEILSKIWGIPELELFSKFTKNEVKSISESIGGDCNDSETIRILTALFNENYADKRASATQNFLLGQYIARILKIHESDIGFVMYIENLQFAVKENYDFLRGLIKQLHEMCIGCILQFQEPEYEISNGIDFTEDLNLLARCQKVRLNPLTRKQAVGFVKSACPELSRHIAELIVDQAGTRIQSLSSLLAYLTQNQGGNLCDDRTLIKKLQALTANDVSGLMGMLLTGYRRKYADIFEISYLLDCRVPLRICTLLDISPSTIDALIAAGIFRCDQGVLVAMNGFVQKWIQELEGPLGSARIYSCAEKLLPLLEKEKNSYTIEKISLCCALGQYKRGLDLLDANLLTWAHDKQYTALNRGLTIALHAVRELGDTEREADYLIQALDLMTIQKKLSGILAQERLDRLEQHVRRGLPQYMSMALAFFRLKRAFKLGRFANDDPEVSPGAIYYQKCTAGQITENKGDWLGRICSCYALTIKSTHGNRAALAAFEAAVRVLPNSFDLRREYLSHLACMELFDKPLAAFGHYQQILALFEHEAPDSVALPFHEYGDLAMSQLIAGNLPEARSLAEDAIRISQSNGLLDEEGRNLNIRGCIELCEGDYKSAESSFQEATAIMRHAGCLNYVWRSELNYIEIQVLNCKRTPDIQRRFEELYRDFRSLLTDKVAALVTDGAADFKKSREYHALLVLGLCWIFFDDEDVEAPRVIKDFNLQKYEKSYSRHLREFLNQKPDFMDSPYLKNGYIYSVG